MSDRDRRVHCFVDVEIGGNSAGRIVLELFSDVCPKTCCNFVKLCSGVKVDDELVCFKGKPFSALDCAVKVECTCSSHAVHDELRNKIYPDEVSVLKHFKELLLTTANRGSDANGLQWMITTASTPELNSTHLVFGRVVSGQGVVEQIHAATKDDQSRGTVRARIGNCGELKTRSSDQRKPPAIYQTLTDFYNSRDTPDDSQEDSCAKAVALASLFKKNNRLSRVGTSTPGDRKIKGRGTVRYRGSSSRSQSESDDTPPHWRTELEKVKPLGKDVKEMPEDRWIKGDKLVYVESLSRKSARYSRAESDDEDAGLHRRRTEKYSWEDEDDSDERSSSQRSRKKSTRHSRRYESDEEDSRSYCRMLEKHYGRRGKSESDEDRKYRKRSRRRSSSVEYDSSDHSPQRFIKKSKKLYSKRGDFESDDEKPKRLSKSKHSQSSDYDVDDDNATSSKKKRLRHHARSHRLKNNEEITGRSSKSSRKCSGRHKDKLNDDSSDQYCTRSESRDSRTEGSEDTDEKHRSGHFKGSAQSPLRKKGFSKRKTMQKKERDKHRKHSKKFREFSREPFSESESEHSRTSALNSCDLKPGKSESLHLKALRSKSTGKKDSRHVKLKAIKDNSGSKDSRDFDIKSDHNNSSLEKFSDAFKQVKKTSGLPGCKSSRYSFKSKVNSLDEEIKAVRRSRKAGRSSKAKNTKSQTIGEKLKQKFKDSQKLNSKTSKEKTAVNQVAPKKSIWRGDKVEIVIPSSEEDEENAIVEPPLKKKKKLKLDLFDSDVTHASSSTRTKKDKRSALKEDVHVTEKRSRKVIKKSGEKMEEFRLSSRSSKGSVSNNGSVLRTECSDGSEEMPGSRSCLDSRPGEMVRSGGKKLERILEIPKSGSSDDDEEIQSSLTVEDKRIQSNKISAKPHSFGSNYSLELSRKYNQMKILRLRNKLKELEANFHAETQLQLSLSSSSRSDNHALSVQPDVVSKKESKPQSDKMPSSSHCLSSAPKRQIHGEEISPKGRSNSRTSSRRSNKSQGKHGRWSLSPEIQRKKMCSYSSSSRSYSSGSESSRSQRTGRRHATVSSSSGKSTSRTRSSSRSRSRSRIKSVSRERRRTSPSHRLVNEKEVPALASVATVVLPSGNSLTVVGKNMSESPPPSRWKPGQKPWKPKNMLPASNSVAEYEKMKSALSASSAQRTDNIQKSQSQKSSKVGRSSHTDDQGRGNEKSRVLKIRGQRRDSYSSEGSSQNSSTSRSVRKGRSYNRTDSDSSQSRSQSRSDWSKSRSDRSKSRSDRSKSRSDRSKSYRSRNERSNSRSDSSGNEGSKSRNERSKSRYERNKSRSDSNKSDQSTNKSHYSLYNSKAKASKIIGSGYSSRSDSTSSSSSQTNDTGSSRTSNRSSRSKVTGGRNDMTTGATSRSDGINDQSYNNDNEHRRVVKKSSAPNAHSSGELIQPNDALVTSSGDSDAYNKRTAVKLDKLKTVKKEKADKRKKDSQVPWEPPVEPEYILVDTDDEGSKRDDQNRVLIRKKWIKKGCDVAEADHDMTTMTSEELSAISDEKSADKENRERPSENDDTTRTILEVQEGRSGKPEDADLCEHSKVAVTEDARLDLSDMLEKPCFKTVMDITEVNTSIQSFILEAEDSILDFVVESHITAVKVEDQIADAKTGHQIEDVKTGNQIVGVNDVSQVVGVNDENQVADVKVENLIADEKAAIEVAVVSTMNEVVDADDQTMNINSQNDIADVKCENLAAENEVMLNVNAEIQGISDADVLDQTKESLLLHSETTDDDGRKGHEIRRTDNALGDGAAIQSDILATESKASDAVNAEGFTPQTASETCSIIITLAAEKIEDSEVGSKVAIPSSSVLELTPKSQMTFRHHQSRSGPSNLPRSNLQDNRLLDKQLNFTWKSRSRLPVSGSAGVVRLNSPESPHVPALSPGKLDHSASVVDETSVLAEDSVVEKGEKRRVFSKRSSKEGPQVDGESRLNSDAAALRRSPCAKSSVSSDESSSSSSSRSSRVSISSSSSSHLERSPSARCASGRSYSNSPSQSSGSGSEARRHRSQGSDSRSRSSVSEHRGRSVRTRSRSRTRRETRSRTRSRSRRRTRSRTRSMSRRAHHRSRSQRSGRTRRSYSKRSSRSPRRRRRRSRSLTRRSVGSQSGGSRSRTNSRTPRSRSGRRRTRSRSTRSRTTSRRHGYSRQMSSCSESDSRSRSASRNRSYRRRRCESQDSYRKRRSSPSSRSRSSSSN